MHGAATPADRKSIVVYPRALKVVLARVQEVERVLVRLKANDVALAEAFKNRLTHKGG